MLQKYRYKLLKITWLLILMFLSISELFAIQNNIGKSTDSIMIQTTVINESINDSYYRNFKIYFPINSAIILPGFDNNISTINAFKDFLNLCKSDSSLIIKEIIIISSSSIEGPRSFNEKLSNDRYLSFMKYLKNNNINISEYPVNIISKGANWNLFENMIENSNSVYKTDLIKILDNDETDLIRLEKFKKLSNGKAFSYLKKEIFPKMRFININVNYDSIKVVPVLIIPEDTELISVEEEIINQPFETPEYIKKPLFAVKTNLLYDAMTALNIGVEVPIRKHWSIAGEWIFPWWKHDRNKLNVKPSRLEVLCGTLEGRYWFGDREDRRDLTGWFTGLFGGGGIYDLQWKAKGYQGDFFMAGVSGGYAHKIGKRTNNLSMEYSLGLGYFRSHYTKYESYYFPDKIWHPKCKHKGVYSWTGPIRAEISLVWMINYKSKKGGSE